MYERTGFMHGYGRTGGYFHGYSRHGLRGYPREFFDDYQPGLGFSLKPPQWVRDAFGRIVSSVKISPPGPINIPLPGGAGQVVLTTQPTHPVEALTQEVNQQVEKNVPGGWNTVALVGAAAVVGFLLLNRGRRRR